MKLVQPLRTQALDELLTSKGGEFRGQRRRGDLNSKNSATETSHFGELTDFRAHGSLPELANVFDALLRRATHHRGHFLQETLEQVLHRHGLMSGRSSLPFTKAPQSLGMDISTMLELRIRIRTNQLSLRYRLGTSGMMT